MYMSKEQIRAELQGKTQEQIIEYVYCKNEEQENQNTLQGTLIHNALVKCQKYEEKIVSLKEEKDKAEKCAVAIFNQYTDACSENNELRKLLDEARTMADDYRVQLGLDKKEWYTPGGERRKVVDPDDLNGDGSQDDKTSNVGNQDGENDGGDSQADGNPDSENEQKAEGDNQAGSDGTSDGSKGGNKGGNKGGKGGKDNGPKIKPKRKGKKEQPNGGTPFTKKLDNLEQRHEFQYTPDLYDRMFGEGNWRAVWGTPIRSLEMPDPVPVCVNTYVPTIEVRVKDPDTGETVRQLVHIPLEEPRLFPRCVATASIVTYFAYLKTKMSCGYYRIAQFMSDVGFPMTRDMITRWTNRAATTYLEPLCKYFLKLLTTEYKVNQLDESPFGVSILDGMAYMTCVKSGELETPKAKGKAKDEDEAKAREDAKARSKPAVAVYISTLERKCEMLVDLYKGKSVIIMADGFSFYNRLAKELGIDRMIDVVHMRRYFVRAFDAIKAKDKIDPWKLARAPENVILLMFRKIAALDTPSKALTVTPEERLALRKEKIAPLFDKLFAIIHDLADHYHVLDKDVLKSIGLKDLEGFEDLELTDEMMDILFSEPEQLNETGDLDSLGLVDPEEMPEADDDDSALPSYSYPDFISGALKKALVYALHHEKYLKPYFENAYVPLDNNSCEACMRPVSLARASYSQSDSVEGGQALAALLTVMQTARLNGENPYLYMRYVLTEMPKYQVDKPGNYPDGFMAALTPWSDRYAGFRDNYMGKAKRTDAEIPEAPWKGSHFYKAKALPSPADGVLCEADLSVSTADADLGGNYGAPISEKGTPGIQANAESSGMSGAAAGSSNQGGTMPSGQGASEPPAAAERPGVSGAAAGPSNQGGTMPFGQDATAPPTTAESPKVSGAAAGSSNQGGTMPSGQGASEPPAAAESPGVSGAAAGSGNQGGTMPFGQDATAPTTAESPGVSGAAAGPSNQGGIAPSRGAEPKKRKPEIGFRWIVKAPASDPRQPARR